VTFVTVLSYDFNEGVEEFHTKFAQHYPSRVEAKFWGVGVAYATKQKKLAALHKSQSVRASDSFQHD
jgi:hypothetical protein